MHALLFVFTLHLPPDHPSGDSWFAVDKAKHFFTAALAQSAAFGGFRTLGMNRHSSLWGATAVSGTVSIGKELYDLRTGGDASLKDLTWDAAGIGAMTIVLRQTRP
ncbi:MAG TPA: hypothetical protein VHV78_13805 [Gemmatimonadaceae bacterium]|jgi:uncharacterized protein YfiM (DUF2279 family)|nr:hypothetical protein [Gemmatimonadaceae bacterium]